MKEQQRFLSTDEKQGEVESFASYRAERGHYRTAHPSAKGGEGWIDPEVMPLVDALNALPGVCTVQSCCGHRAGEHVHSGQLWLRLSREVATRFEARVGALLAADVIEHVQKLYSYRGQSEPHEVLDIQWQEGRMKEAERFLTAFFRALAHDPQGGTNGSSR